MGSQNWWFAIQGQTPPQEDPMILRDLCIYHTWILWGKNNTIPAVSRANLAPTMRWDGKRPYHQTDLDLLVRCLEKNKIKSNIFFQIVVKMVIYHGRIHQKNKKTPKKTNPSWLTRPSKEVSQRGGLGDQKQQRTHLLWGDVYYPPGN